MTKKEISKYMSMLGKRARRLKPYTKEQYRIMQKLSTKSKLAKKLSTPKVD